ncbi:MAG: hypothetical protein B5M54_00140 [Candidatus Aminicenantes bacterium 4484_214]|nr:MAG: hypothetical protein B5M54_00140 [Candidatus Aminicenantes bacterium 4484_214]
MMLLMKLLILVLVLLVLIRLKIEISIVLLLGTGLLEILFPVPLGVFWRNIGESIFNSQSLSLVGIVVLVLFLGRFLQIQGNFNQMVRSLQQSIREPRLILAIPPALIGLLPMLGGALVSAPIVEEASRKWSLSPAWKTFYNYWFRHIWEYCWPLYVNMILAAAIIQVPIMRISIFQFPFTLLAAALGLFVLFRQVKPIDIPAKKLKPQEVLTHLGESLWAIWPIILIIIFIFIFKLSMLLALALSVGLTQVFFRSPLPKRWQIFKESFSWKTVLLVLAVMIFKGMLEKSSALTGLEQLLHTDGWWAYFLLFFIPFVLAFLTGVNHAYVGISFPLLLPIIGQGNPDMILLMFAYVSGFVGILLSPAHLCLVLTLDYFRASLKDVYRIMIIPVIIIFMAAFLVLLVFRIV